jgi:hypothetical protein
MQRFVSRSTLFYVGNYRNQVRQTFPTELPTQGGSDCGGVFYRLVKSDPPRIEDFLSHAEMGKAPNADACDRCGLSIYSKHGDANALYQRVVSRHGKEGTSIGRLVARLKLSPVHGRQLATPNKKVNDSHTTWWPYLETNRLSSFDAIV